METEPTVIPDVIRDDEVDVNVAIRDQNNSIRQMLSDVDSTRADGAPSLLDTWDRISQFRDLNDLVKTNMLQIQHMLQEAFEEHQRTKILDNNRLRDLKDKAKEDPKYASDYEKESQFIRMQRNEERKNIERMAAASTNLAKEYRQCAMQRAMFVHVALIQQFAILIAGSIQRNVKDPNAWKAISEDIQRFKRMCFPAQEESIRA